MSTYIGAGKVAEVARAVRAWRAETVIFDDELSPGQLRNLEKAFSGSKEGGVRVCDRTALILDIFSQRAATREGKLQVRVLGPGGGGIGGLWGVWLWALLVQLVEGMGLRPGGSLFPPPPHLTLTLPAHPPRPRWSWPRWSTSCRG